MHTQRSRFNFPHRAQCSRLLSYALLFLFIYSSTAQAVHNHGKVVRGVPAAAGFVLNDGSTTSSTKGPATAGECLVCQFQQNLSSAEIFTPLIVLAPAVSPEIVSSPAASFRSIARSTGQGRAPPVTS